MDSGARVSAIVLTWNSSRHIGRSLAALRNECARVRTDLIVVDNGSSDDSLQIVSQHTADARVIRNYRNVGVARARNQGMRLGDSSYILLLDSDAEMMPGSLEEMVRFLDVHAQVGIVGPKLVDPDGAVQYSCRRFPTIPGKLLRQFPLSVRQLVPWAADEEMHDLDRSVAQPVDYVIGACQLIRRSVAENVGELDERMFYGPEDVDFCLRAWRAHWEVWYLPSAVVVHHEQRVSRQRPGMLTLRHSLALAYFFWKHRYIWKRPSFERPEVRVMRVEEGGP